jgi:hypothetical protein
MTEKKKPRTSHNANLMLKVLRELADYEVDEVQTLVETYKIKQVMKEERLKKAKRERR